MGSIRGVLLFFLSILVYLWASAAEADKLAYGKSKGRRFGFYSVQHHTCFPAVKERKYNPTCTNHGCHPVQRVLDPAQWVGCWVRPLLKGLRGGHTPP